jgi:hypothetical protein
MILTSIDGFGQDLVKNITVERDGGMISMSIDDVLPSKLLWKVSVLAYGCESDNVVRDGTVISE